MEIVENFILGIVGGVVSGLIVEYFCSRYRKKKDEQISFKNDVQLYHRYLCRLKLELSISYKHNDYSCVLQMIEERPIISSFKDLDSDSCQLIEKIDEKIKELNQLCEDDKMDENKYKVYNGYLSKYCVESLRLKNESF